jgi:transcriptional regulator NrdR family protein
VKCPRCDAWTIVKDTRINRRRRECANGHRFWTLELLEETVRGHLNGHSRTTDGTSIKQDVLNKIPQLMKRHLFRKE